jgi:ribosomal protein L21
MSIYAVIKVGAVQQRVSVGDTVEVPHNFPEEAIEPIFMGSSTGGIKADKESLKDSLVEFETMGNTKSKKLTFFNIRIKLATEEEWVTEKIKKLSK